MQTNVNHTNVQRSLVLIESAVDRFPGITGPALVLLCDQADEEPLSNSQWALTRIERHHARRLLFDVIQNELKQ